MNRMGQEHTCAVIITVIVTIIVAMAAKCSRNGDGKCPHMRGLIGE